MLKRFTIILFLMAASLSGCESFNHLDVTYQQLPGLQRKEISAETKFVVSGVTEIVPPGGVDQKIIKAPPEVSPEQKRDEKLLQSLCPVYHLPVLPPAPEAPLDKLGQLQPTDTSAILELAREYIIQLHQHGDQVQTLLSKSYQSYISSCITLKKRNHPKM